jgi:Fe-S oxidoreductase
MGWDDDQKLLHDAGVDAEQLESGCCGLAGNFGFTAGHGQVSSALAHRVLVPRVDEAPTDTAVLADGFSCRTQIREYADASRRPVHLAELIAEGLRARH